MLSLPTGHYVNTYAPLEKKAEDLLNLSDGNVSHCSEHSGGCGHQRKIIEAHYLDVTLPMQRHSVLL